MAPSPPTPRSHPSGKRFKLRIATCIGLLAFAALAWGGYAYLSPDWRAERELKSAREASADADYERAKEHLEQLIRIRPKSAQGHFLLARTHRQTDDLSAARKHLKEAKHLGFAAAEVEIEDHLIEAQEYGPRGPIEKSLQSLVNIRHPSEKVILEGLVKGYQNAHLPVAAVKWLAIWIERFLDRPARTVFLGLVGKVVPRQDFAAQ